MATTEQTRYYGLWRDHPEITGFVRQTAIRNYRVMRKFGLTRNMARCMAGQSLAMVGHDRAMAALDAVAR